MTKTTVPAPVMDLDPSHLLPGPIQELKVETPTVDRMMAKFSGQWETTAALCIERAGQLEDAATDLRQRAADLLDAVSLTRQMKETVIYEIEARNRAASLALVQPPPEL